MPVDVIRLLSAGLSTALICWSLATIIYRAVRARRAGVDTLDIAVWATTVLIGLAIAVLAAIFSGRFAGQVAWGATRSLKLALAAQVGGAFVGSWLAVRVYAKRLAGSIRTWFAGEGRGMHG